MKTVLVSGSGGQLGECIRDIETNHPEINFIFADHSKLDITNSKKTNSFFGQNNIDWCINCAAYTNVDLAESEQQKAFEVNEKGAENLAIACNNNNIKLIHISTDFVFDGSKKVPYKETDFTNPINVYGLSKMKGEQKISEILKEHYIIRTSWLYSEHRRNFMKTMLKLSETRNEISVVDDQIGSPTYARDLTDVVMSIIKNNIDDYGLYHFSNKGETSWYGFAKKIFELVGININVKPIPSTDFKTDAKRPCYSVMDTSKIENTLGLNIENWKTSLKKAISKLNE